MNLNAAMKPPSTWAEFCTFLKEHVSPAKLRIATIGKKVHTLKQRAGQTVPQLIAYLEALEWQWPEPLQDSVRANYLTQALHDYIRKELGRREVDMSSRKAVEEAAMTIENTCGRATSVVLTQPVSIANDDTRYQKHRGIDGSGHRPHFDKFDG